MLGKLLLHWKVELGTGREVLQYELTGRVILPFHCGAEPMEVEGTIPGESFETFFALDYPDSIGVWPESKLKFELGPCSMITIRRQMLNCLPADEIRSWVYQNHSRVIHSSILPALNHFLVHLKLNHTGPLGAHVVRSVGEVDLVTSSLLVDGAPASSRVSQTFLCAVDEPPRFTSVDVDITREIPNELLILTRAVDLVNQGYYREAFVIGFALLDELIQGFLVGRMPNLSSEQAEDLLRRVERERMQTFFGHVLLLVTGSTPRKDDSLWSELKFLNTKRNGLLHSGAACSLSEARRGLEAVLKLLRYLDDLGGGYSLPAKLSFWSG